MSLDAFILIINSDEQDPRPIFVNLSQLVVARVIENGVALQLVGQPELRIMGTASTELIAMLMHRSILPNGQPVPENSIPWR